ncbi:zinc finger protein 512 [Brachionichthys hirsutus]|uniref:zinc finger protein 512 n=1 Tax=Brachionichthys hirsutus TaxID=412623 RepID=UPI003604D922
MVRAVRSAVPESEHLDQASVSAAAVLRVLTAGGAATEEAGPDGMEATRPTIRGTPECFHRNRRLPNRQLFGDVIRWPGQWRRTGVGGSTRCKASSKSGGEQCVAPKSGGQQGAELDLRQGQRPRDLGPRQRQITGARLELRQRPGRTLHSRSDVDPRSGRGSCWTGSNLDDQPSTRSRAELGSQQRARTDPGLEHRRGSRRILGARADLNMKKVQRPEMEQGPTGSNFPQPPEGRVSGSDGAGVGDASTVQQSEDQKPFCLSTKKEPPSYPPGSQEECWQLQIVAKGRVTCPKCKSVSRKTVEGLKKHMENCRLQPFTCPHCGKQLKSSTGMKYHIMADHSHLPSSGDTKDLDDRVIKDKLRKILKRLGKLKCSREGCNGAFTSIMGYVYHMKKCGKEESELEKMLLSCSHCGKAYKSKAGLEYHLKSEHAPVSPSRKREADPVRTASGRVQRASAQVANFHLAEIANNELPKDWPKRKFQSDLVPDDKKLKYARPGLPAFSQEVLRKWKSEVKLQRKVQCPNQGCGSTYTSVSGLKAHLGLCTRGDFEAGKYRCLICSKEFNSESGVKYHINSVHSQDWFVTNKKASKTFEKFLKSQPKQFVHNVAKLNTDRRQQHQFHHQPPQHPLQPLHHLQQQTQYLHPEHQSPPPQADAQHQRPTLHYTSLEPPPQSMWADIRGATPGPEQAPIEVEADEVGKSEVDNTGMRRWQHIQRIRGGAAGPAGADRPVGAETSGHHGAAS